MKRVLVSDDNGHQWAIDASLKEQVNKYISDIDYEWSEEKEEDLEEVLKMAKAVEIEGDFVFYLPSDVDEDLRWLRCLEDAGVDNWEGINFAKEEFNS